jgi:hypothetical protein
MPKYIPPPPPTLEKTVAGYGGIKKYLDDPEIMKQNNGLDSHDILLLLGVSYAAAADKTGRDVRTVKRWNRLHANN